LYEESIYMAERYVEVCYDLTNSALRLRCLGEKKLNYLLSTINYQQIITTYYMGMCTLMTDVSEKNWSSYEVQITLS
jgi:hypothetical protein